MIRVSGQAYQYPGSRRIAFQDFDIGAGAHGLLLGDSGSGKTTLLHLVGGLLRAQQGTIEVQGTDLAKLSESRLDDFRGKHVGFVFQKNHLITALSVEKNLLVAPFFAGLPPDLVRVEEILRSLGIEEQRHARIRELSHGQAQRVAIARALINRPGVILADEPTSALDDRNCEKVIRLLIDASEKQGATLLVATHDQRLKKIIPHQIQL
ncbi:MAG: ATP-binding cassette domain-containing protein [Cytophagales bacterium]|nr:ATP-binding cassette domain-containing protein [Cytophagales bacterium]